MKFKEFVEKYLPHIKLEVWMIEIADEMADGKRVTLNKRPGFNTLKFAFNIYARWLHRLGKAPLRIMGAVCDLPEGFDPDTCRLFQIYGKKLIVVQDGKPVQEFNEKTKEFEEVEYYG